MPTGNNWRPGWRKIETRTLGRRKSTASSCFGVIGTLQRIWCERSRNIVCRRQLLDWLETISDPGASFQPDTAIHLLRRTFGQKGRRGRTVQGVAPGFAVKTGGVAM